MFESLIESAMQLAPRAGWMIGVELARVLVLLTVVAVAIRAAGGVRARYRIVGAGIVLALLLPLAGVSPGVWTVSVPVDLRASPMNTVVPGAPVVNAEAEYRHALQTELGQEISSDPYQSVRLQAAAVDSATVVTPLESRDTQVSTGFPLATTPTGSTAGAGFEVLGWTVADAKIAGEKTMAWIEAASYQPITWVLLWALGFVCVLTWGLVGVIRLATIARTAHPVDDRWTIEADRVVKRLGIRRKVRVVSSDKVPVPMTWGVWRPIVVVPAMASEWNAERRRVVLTHELVHVRRLDWALQIAAWVVVAAHWCNPLAWWAVRRLAVERERSCDAAVVASGTRPSAYASHLLDIARAMSDVRSPVHALGMAKASELEGRLMSILNGNRRSAKRSVAAAMLVMCAGLAAAAVVPEAIPPEKQAELDRYEAELAIMEEKLAAKRDALEAKRAVIELQAQAEYEELTDDETHKRHRELKEREVRAHERHAEREVREGREIREGREVRSGHEQAIAKEIERRFERRAPKIFEHWQNLSKNQGELYEQLSNYKLRTDPRMGELYKHLNSLGGELELHGVELEQIVERLAPFHEKMEGRHLKLEPLHLELQTLQESMHVEIDELNSQLHEVLESPEMHARVEGFRVNANEIQAEIAALAKQIAAAVKAGDYDQVQEIGAMMAELAQSQEDVRVVVEGRAHEVRAHAEQIADKIRQQQDQIRTRIHKHMEGVHEQMEHLHKGMDEMHEGMDGVHGEMDGVHQKMDGVHQKLETVHLKIETVIREIVREIVREALQEHGINADDDQGEKIISAASGFVGGSRMQLTTDGDTELVQITDKVEQFKQMREAVAKAEAAGEFKLNDKILDRLDAALKAAAAEGEVLRFKLNSDEKRTRQSSPRNIRIDRSSNLRTDPSHEI